MCCLDLYIEILYKHRSSSVYFCCKDIQLHAHTHTHTRTLTQERTQTKATNGQTKHVHMHANHIPWCGQYGLFQCRSSCKHPHPHAHRQTSRHTDTQTRVCWCVYRRAKEKQDLHKCIHIQMYRYGYINTFMHRYVQVPLASFSDLLLTHLPPTLLLPSPHSFPPPPLILSAYMW